MTDQGPIPRIGFGTFDRTGEAGIAEWLGSVERRFPDWTVYLSPELGEGDSHVAALKGAFVGQSVEFVIRNTADQSETITVSAADGVTLSGTMTIAQNNSKRFLAVLTNVTAGSQAYTLYSLGTFTH